MLFLSSKSTGIKLVGSAKRCCESQPCCGSHSLAVLCTLNSSSECLLAATAQLTGLLLLCKNASRQAHSFSTGLLGLTSACAPAFCRPCRNAPLACS